MVMTPHIFRLESTLQTFRLDATLQTVRHVSTLPKHLAMTQL
jgi:hypothetical protein